MYEQINTYISREIYPFHMPGHKRNPMFLPQGMGNLDITEIPGMDVLSQPAGIIHELQGAIAEFYGASESYLLVNGSSAGIVAAICATCNHGTPLYAPRNGHVSMYNGIALSGATPIYIIPEITPDGLAGGINPEVLDSMKEGAAVLIVSPTYEGFVSDIKEIATRVHSRGGILIVDEAHGAHFRFSDAFPASALELGADIVIQSFHKTLPALGQTAVLHVKGTRVDTARLRFYLQAMQTTSPSYMLMGQLDYALSMLWKRPEIFETYINRLNGIRRALSTTAIQAIGLTGRERAGSHGIYDTDPGKLLFRINIYENPEAITEMLSNQYRVQMEMACGHHLLAMTSVADTDEGFQRLWGAIGSLNIKLEHKLDTTAKGQVDWGANSDNKKCKPYDVIRFGIPEAIMPIKDAIIQKTECVEWENAPGRIAAEIIAAYPPGIALVAPGERIPQGLPQLAQRIQVVK